MNLVQIHWFCTLGNLVWELHSPENMVRAKRILNFPVIKWDAGDDRSCLPFLSDGEETEKEKEGTSAIDL